MDEATKHRAIGIGLGVFGLVFLLVGWIMHGKANATKSWPTVPGTVVTSKVEARESTSTSTTSGRRGRREKMYAAKVAYRYEVEGRSYTSDGISLVESSSSTPAGAKETVASYPKGAKVTVHYDPDDPEESVLEPGGGGWGIGGMIIGLLAMGLGVVGVVKAPEQASGGGAPRRRRRSRSRRGAEDDDPDPDLDDDLQA